MQSQVLSQNTLTLQNLYIARCKLEISNVILILVVLSVFYSNFFFFFSLMYAIESIRLNWPVYLQWGIWPWWQKMYSTYFTVMPHSFKFIICLLGLFGMIDGDILLWAKNVWHSPLCCCVFTPMVKAAETDVTLF